MVASRDSGRRYRAASLPRTRRFHGFTLIELMIVIAVVGILMAIAVASYEFAVVKSRRSAAQGCLTEAAQYMERYYTTRLSYEDAEIPACSAEVAGHYDLSFSAGPDATSYTIQAMPRGRQGEVEKKCRTMTMDQAGRRTAATDDCW